MSMTAARTIQRDRTSQFQNLVVQLCKEKRDVDELDVRSSQILRPARGSKSDFSKALDGVSSLIAALGRILAESRAGELNSEIEAQITEYIQQCKSNIDALQNLCLEGARGSVRSDSSTNVSPMEQAHRQGCVLILAERLKGCMTTFEGIQRARAARIDQAELLRRRRTPALKSASRKDSTSLVNMGNNRGPSFSSNPSDVTPLSSQTAQQQSFQSENYALQQDLSSLTDQAQHAERTVREIASLNQAFSAALFHQAEQIEMLYNQAVDASNCMDMGNFQLKKTVKTNSKSRKWLFIILVVFSLMLLFFDWWYG